MRHHGFYFCLDGTVQFGASHTVFQSGKRWTTAPFQEGGHDHPRHRNLLQSFPFWFKAWPWGPGSYSFVTHSFVYNVIHEFKTRNLTLVGSWGSNGKDLYTTVLGPWSNHLKETLFVDRVALRISAVSMDGKGGVESRKDFSSSCKATLLSQVQGGS